jgi:hypothetical protein
MPAALASFALVGTRVVAFVLLAVFSQILRSLLLLDGEPR